MAKGCQNQSRNDRVNPNRIFGNRVTTAENEFEMSDRRKRCQKRFFTLRKILSRGLWLKTMALTASQRQKHSHGYALWKLWKLCCTRPNPACHMPSSAALTDQENVEPNRTDSRREGEPNRNHSSFKQRKRIETNRRFPDISRSPSLDRNWVYRNLPPSLSAFIQPPIPPPVCPTSHPIASTSLTVHIYSLTLSLLSIHPPSYSSNWRFIQLSKVFTYPHYHLLSISLCLHQSASL